MKSTALLLMYFQKDFFDGGKAPIHGAGAAAKAAGNLLQCFRDHNGCHIHIQLENRNNGLHYCQPSTEGIRIHDDVAHYEGEPIVHTSTMNAFTTEDLDTVLKARKIERLIFCGLHETALSVSLSTAKSKGYEVWLCSEASSDALDDVFGNVPRLGVDSILARLAAEQAQSLPQRGR